METSDMQLALFQIHIRRGFDSVHRPTRKCTRHPEAVLNIPAHGKQQLDLYRFESPTLVGVFAANHLVEVEL